MSIYVWTSEIKNIYVWTTPVKEVYVGTTKIRPTTPPYLCFTANTAGSTVQLTKTWSPTSVTLETSTDGINWTSYYPNWTRTLSNIWDKVYFRNTSETTTGFSTNTSNYYKFVMTWSIAASWDTTSLINKNLTDTLSWGYCFLLLFHNCTSLTSAPELPATTITNNCYYSMFNWCTNLTTAPKLPATTLVQYCYSSMFSDCSNLEILPKLPATTLKNYCYSNMFKWCSKIKLNTTQTWEYQTPYRIPTTWTGATATGALGNMFRATWWTFTSDPTINTTYYTSNTLI